jgi:hypothetical protein
MFRHKITIVREVVTNGKRKCKAIPVQARTGPEVSRKLRLPDFKKIGTRMW